jgi:hypothetical protein
MKPSDTTVSGSALWERLRLAPCGFFATYTGIGMHRKPVVIMCERLAFVNPTPAYNTEHILFGNPPSRRARIITRLPVQVFHRQLRAG